ncbi:short-chain dehydrogenase srdF-like [Crotalus tigris]|uniref:short-chain dehydrogenase srdF-like n=1 Tax=Crotalus tigris TaxID=88082 RepID=UPI00192F2F6E|nr:short-chain dehydrogenase srdF-like [Crotalus tigris]
MQKCVGESGLTLLINNAGLKVGNNLERENAKDMMTVYSVNTIGPLQMSQACLPLLKLAARRSPCQGLSSSKAAIINISSALGSIELMERWDIAKRVAYRCSKTALNMLTKCQSLDYAAHGILCVALNPGRVKTSKEEE